jgi:hypothetical protein
VPKALDTNFSFEKGENGGMWVLGDMRNKHKILVGNPEGKRPLGKSRRRWEDNIRIDLRKIGR